MSVDAIGLVGPAAPWMGGIAQFTTTLADRLRARSAARWLSWQVNEVCAAASALCAGRSWARYVELLDTALDPLAAIEGGP